jgi:hypothetical protein
MYRNRNAIVTAGKTKPTRGTKIEGKKAAATSDILIETMVYDRSYPNFSI